MLGDLLAATGRKRRACDEYAAESRAPDAIASCNVAPRAGTLACFFITAHDRETQLETHEESLSLLRHIAKTTLERNEAAVSSFRR